EPARKVICQIARVRPPSRRAPEMQADADRFALDEYAGLAVSEGVEGGLRIIHGRAARGRFDILAWPRELQAMRSCEEEVGETQIAQGHDRPATDDRQATLQPVAQPG